MRRSISLLSALLLVSLICVAASDSLSSASTSASSTSIAYSGSSGSGSSSSSDSAVPVILNITSSSSTIPANRDISSSSSSIGSTGTIRPPPPPPAPESSLPVVDSTLGCVDDVCDGCRTTQGCVGGEQLTMTGRNFCPVGTAELMLGQYSSVHRCDNYRLVDRQSTTQATCFVPSMPSGYAWQSQQVYVRLRCVGEEPSQLYPALWYSTSGAPSRRWRPDGWAISTISIASVIVLVAVWAVIRCCRLARLRAAGGASGAVLTSVTVPMCEPLIGETSLADASAVPHNSPLPTAQPPHDQPPAQYQHQPEQPQHANIYNASGAPFKADAYAYPQLTYGQRQPAMQH